MTTDTLLATEEPRWAAALFDGDSGGMAQDAYRFGSGLALAAVFGLAIGARFGLSAMAGYAAGVPSAIVAVALFGVPAFYIGLAHVGLDVDVRRLVSTTGRGAAMAGLILAGLSPAMLLFSITCEHLGSVAICAATGLAAGSALGLRTMFRGLGTAAGKPGAIGAWVLKMSFTLFACVLSARIWTWALPIFGGGR